MKFQHLVVSRLTVKQFSDEFSPEWLDDRLRLFRDYCVPSMAAQTRDRYRWLILCDETTDPDFIDSIKESASRVPQLRVAATSQERNVRIPDAVAPTVDDDTELLITTRLDADDCFHAEMIATVQSYVDAFSRSPSNRWVLDFPRGYRYDEPSRRLYARYKANSPFASMFEKLRPGKTFRTAYGNHSKLHLKTPVHYDVSIPGWIQVIHGFAKSTEPKSGTVLTPGNRVTTLSEQDKDIEVDPAEIEGSFGVDLGATASQPFERESVS
jgi:hypothetical protein